MKLVKAGSADPDSFSFMLCPLQISLLCSFGYLKRVRSVVHYLSAFFAYTTFSCHLCTLNIYPKKVSYIVPFGKIKQKLIIKN